MILWLLLFADDWKALFGKEDGEFRVLLLLLLFIFAIFGVPLSWAKVARGRLLAWVGGS